MSMKPPRRKEGRDVVRLSIALDAELWERAKDAAVDEKRQKGQKGRPSLNALIAQALTEYLDRHHRGKGRP